MAFLRTINSLYDGSEESEALYRKAHAKFLEGYGTCYDILRRICYYLSIVIFLASIYVSVMLLINLQTNMISWIFFALFVLIYANIAKQDHSVGGL